MGRKLPIHYVYFIKEKLGCDAPIKIGVAKNVGVRLKGLQTGNPRTLIVLAKIGPMTVKQAYATEERLHKFFKRHHIRGEWFSGAIQAYMHRLSEEVDFSDGKGFSTARKSA